MDLRNIDLNLLVVLDALLEVRNVTRAGARLGLSQPATSRALARLRALFGDALLVEGAGGYILSTRAEALRPHLRATLSQINGLLQPAEFNPATATGTIRLAMPDMLAAALLPGVLARLAEAAPTMALDVISPGAAPFRLLEEDQADVVIGLIDEAPAAIRRRSLSDERMVTLMRRDHPAARFGLTLERFLALEHIVVAITGTGPALVDEALRRQGLSRRVKARVPGFFAALEIVARSDLVVTLPESLARTALAEAGLHIATPPVDLAPVTMSMAWHARHHDLPEHKWLRGVIVGAG